jgi:hypothetical protein
MAMSKKDRHERKITVKGISEPKALERLESSLANRFMLKKIDDRGQYVLRHLKITTLGEPKTADVIVYTSEKIFISASPSLPDEDFKSIADVIARIIQDSTQSLKETRPVTVARAESIFKFAKGIGLDDEYKRMVAVILTDTSIEITLTEKLKSYRVSGPTLEQGVPEKIKMIEEKGGAVASKDDIINIRDLRNGIVHKGEIPTEEQCQMALKVAQEYLNSI